MMVTVPLSVGERGLREKCGSERAFRAVRISFGGLARCFDGLARCFGGVTWYFGGGVQSVFGGRVQGILGGEYRVFWGRVTGWGGAAVMLRTLGLLLLQPQRFGC